MVAVLFNQGLGQGTQGFGGVGFEYAYAFFRSGDINIIPKDLRVLPLLLSGFFLLLQVVYACVVRWKPSAGEEKQDEDLVALGEDSEARDGGFRSKIGNIVRRHGGCTIFGFMVARLVGTTSLFCLFVATSRNSCETSSVDGVCPQTYLTSSIAYATLLAVASFGTNRAWLSPVRFHVMTLLSVLAVYVYRDIWPLATNYGLQPADIAEGKILWVKISLLVFTAVIIPAFIPHVYVPVDPKNPEPEPNSEQTASWISALTYSYLDSLILLANRVPHLRHDQLPPLADYDRARYLSASAAMHVDPFAGAKRRHLFFGLLSFFREEYIIINVCLLFISLSSFAAPIGINKTLNYLETREDTVKPWVWISFMMIGPIAQSIFEHWNLYVQTKVRVRIQALLTQLIFEHSLRIRMKAETPNSGKTTTTSVAEEEEQSVVSSENSTIGDDDDGSERQGQEDAGSEYTQGSTAVGSRDTSTTSEATQTTIKQKSSGKGKAKAKGDEGKSAKKGSGDAENLIGRINNLVTSDLASIVEGCDIFALVVLVPIQIVLSIVFLYKVLGWSALVGLVTTIVLSPVPGYLTKLTQDAQTTKMKLTDARVQSITEVVGVLRMIKLFGWEGKMTKRIEAKRDEELTWLWKIKKLGLATEMASMFIPTVSMLVTYAAYTVLMKGSLTASKIFSSITVFGILRDQLGRIAWQVSYMIEAKVSLDRASSFLQNSELLDVYREKEEEMNTSSLSPPPPAPLVDNHEDDTIGFRNATFSWSLESNDGSLTPSSRKYRLRVDGELLFKTNAINLIVGPTGAGKTSVLMALLGEMHFIPSHADSWFNLPRQGGVAYAAQESWVQNATIRENIIFGSAFDEERYKKVIRQCALEHDLELFEAGDATEVGERGLTLSGGQKARVTLARAIYSSAKIILLDDVLAALDVHTSAWIVDQCFRGDLVKGRTILLVTHNVALAGPVADFVISLGLDGSIKVKDTEAIKAELKETLTAKEILEDEIESKVEETSKQPPPKAPTVGKLVMAEEIVEGHITWRSLKLLFVGLGGKHPVFFGVNWFIGLVLGQFFRIVQPWFLGIWGSEYENHSPSQINLKFYLLVLAAIIGFRLVTYSCLSLYYNHRAIGASRLIHSELVKSVFGSTLRWLDETPTGRIIARCTQDIRTVDAEIPQALMWVADQSFGVVCTLGSIVLFTPVFLLPGIIVGCLGVFIGNVYLRAQLSIKREMSNARSPVLAHFSAAIHGLVSIRAYGSQASFSGESLKRIDLYSRIARTSWNVNRWVGFRIDALGASFTTLLAFYLIYGESGTSAGNAGFSLNMAVSFCMYIFWLIRIFNQLEVESNSLERIQGYIDIEHEPKSSVSGEPPAAWPTSGDLRVEGLSARYSQSGPKVLHDLTFHVTSGQRIGIVGRTGSGKSSLTLALLRCILTEGTVFYDGIDTNTLNLDALRSNVTIIPQTPELLSGTLRQNLDPFDQNDDATLNDALRAAGLFSLQEEAGEARLTLESNIAGGGNNLSVGQRQIIALARAMVRGSKLLILDEATSAIDYNTDSIIQNTLRHRLGPDVTVITVAHRLQTIMDADKIMVLDSGRIAEFDKPKILLQNENGALRALVDGSGDKAVLYSLANRQ